MYLSTVPEQVKRATEYLAAMDSHPRQPAQDDAEGLADWAALRADLEAFIAAPAAHWEGGSFQASVAVYETLGLLWNSYSGDRRMTRAAEQKRRELAELEAVTYEVQEIRNGKLAKPRRVARTTVDEWFAREGFTVKAEPFKVQARGSFDSSQGDGHPTGGYTVTTLTIGTELPEGTVKSKRIVKRPDGKVVEYLLKKRGQAAEARYRRVQRIKELS